MSLSSSGVIALTVPIVPTGINEGVLMMPLLVSIIPLRALPSDVISLKFMTLF